MILHSWNSCIGDLDYLDLLSMFLFYVMVWLKVAFFMHFAKNF